MKYKLKRHITNTLRQAHREQAPAREEGQTMIKKLEAEEERLQSNKTKQGRTATALAMPEPFKPPADMFIVTTPFVSGYRITHVIGATFGLIVRSRGLGQKIWAFFRAWGGGEIKVYTQLLEQVRAQALQRLGDHAKSLGANAVISTGFDTSEMGGGMTEVLAYGTAVIVEPDRHPAQPVELH